MLRMVVSGVLPPEQLTSKRMFDTMDLCVECKACKAECPSNVDMAKLKTEFLAKYYETHGLPLRAKAFGNIAALSRIGQRLAPVTNLFSRLSLVRAANQRLLGIASQRPLPKFANQRFSAWFRKRKPQTTSRRGRVVYYHDTFTEFMHPEVGKSAVQVLEALGYEVVLVEQKKCCGRPMISKGQLSEAKKLAKQNVKALLEFAQIGIPIVGTEPSCLLTLRDEYPDLLQDEASREVASQAFMIDELIVKVAEDDANALKNVFGQRSLEPLQVHGHCHQKAIIGTGPTMRALELAGFEAELIDSGCCGMAGTFGFEEEHYEISRAMGNFKLFPAIEADGKRNWGIAVSGISCRQQIDHFTSKRPKHVIEFMAEALLSRPR